MLFERERMKHCADLGTSERATITETWQMLNRIIDQALSGLTRLELDVIKRRYGLTKGYSYSVEDLAKILEITPVRLADVEREAVEKLRLRET
jgi:DNA-directed RNA polymerase sigma subunit (sigma70/sigma32)